VRAVGAHDASVRDRVVADLARVRATLRVVASRCAAEAASAVRAIRSAYRWALDLTAALTDLEVAALDRLVSAAEIEHLGRRATVGCVAAVEPAFAALSDTDGSPEERALRWDLETVRTSIERTLVALYELG
jgi:hypothetical protein